MKSCALSSLKFRQLFVMSIVLLLVGCGGGDSASNDSVGASNDPVGSNSDPVNIKGDSAGNTLKLIGYDKDFDNDGKIDAEYRYEFDSSGNCTRFVEDGKISDFEYDENNNMIYQSDSTGSEGQLDGEQFFQYNAIGKLDSRIIKNIPEDDTIKINYFYEDEQIVRCEYRRKEGENYIAFMTVDVNVIFNSSGYIETVYIDNPNGEIFDETLEFSYDNAGNRISKKTTSATTVYEYDEDNNLIEEKSDNTNDNVFDEFYSASYNTADNSRKFDAYSLFSMAIEFDPYNTIAVDTYEVDRLSDIKFPSVEEQDSDSDGVVEKTTYHFDSEGWPEFSEVDTDGDGTPDERTYYIWGYIQIQ